MEKDNDSCIECYEETESGSPAEKNRVLNIIDDFNEMYNDQLKKAEGATEGTLQLQIKTLQHWVYDLSEQNKMLIKTVEELEKEAMKRIQDPHNVDEIPNQAKSEMDFSKPLSSTELNNQILFTELEETKKQLKLKTLLEAKYLMEIEELKQTLEKERRKKIPSEVKMVVNRGSMTDAYDFGSFSFHYELEAIRLKLAESEKEVTTLKTKLADAENNILTVRSDLCNTEKNARDMRAALTAEVAEKHDQILALKREVSHLEEQLRQADMQTHFKDDIIKKLREDVKVARSKLKYILLEPDETCPSPPDPKPAISDTNKSVAYKKSFQDDLKVLYPDFSQSRKQFADQPVSQSFKSLQNHFTTNESEKEMFRKAKTKSNQQTNLNIVADNKNQRVKGKMTHLASPTDNRLDTFGKGEPTKLSKVDGETCPVHGEVPAWTGTYLSHSFH